MEGAEAKNSMGMRACEKCQVIIAMLGFAINMIRGVSMSQ